MDLTENARKELNFWTIHCRVMEPKDVCLHPCAVSPIKSFPQVIDVTHSVWSWPAVTTEQ